MNAASELESDEGQITPDRIIEFIENYGRQFNMSFRPCIYHYNEGGGITDEDLKSGEGIDFLQTDCITTKEVLKRIFHAKETIEIKIIDKHASEQLIPLIANYSQYGYCIIQINNIVLADAYHWLTIINIKGTTYLIQSYLDHYSYKVKQYNYYDIFKQICHMFDNEDINIANQLMGNVQGSPIETQIPHIRFIFCTYDINNITLALTRENIKNPSLGYTH